MAERVDCVVIGGGQAGLSGSYHLTQAGIEHVVLERARIGESWRTRWDSFCLVTPNWTARLPGHHYDGDDPDGYLPRDDIVAYLEGYADAFEAPVRTGVDVRSLEPTSDGAFDIRTTAGDIKARTVVVATGAYQRPYRPAGSATFPDDLPQLDLADYRNPASLPSGRVLIVGSGQSGCQLAEELLEAGREVFLACGRAPWSPRRLGGRDFVWWAAETGFLDMPLSSLPTREARLAANVQGTGHNGGHDLNYRTLQAMGVTLVGHFIGADGRVVRFAPDLADSVAWGDERYAQFVDLIRKLVADRGPPMPEIPEPLPFDATAPESIDLSGFGAVIFTGGFRPDYGSWMSTPGAFDQFGFPIHSECESLPFPGLFFVGVHFLRKRKSSLLYGVGEDAAIVSGGVAARLGATARAGSTS
jgi:putative flavoprotein involved in K+ transport